jgi:hypothetical protein
MLFAPPVESDTELIHTVTRGHTQRSHAFRRMELADMNARFAPVKF